MARARNTIDKLINEEGVEVFSEAAKGEVAVLYFSNLFKSSNQLLLEHGFKA